VEPYHTELVEQMKAWLAQEGLTYPAETADFHEQDETMIRFKMAVQERYYQELYDLMRDIGVKIPITGTKWTINAANAKTQKILDFDDSHAYFYAWNWGEFKKGNDPRAMVAEKDGMLRGLSYNSSPDRPFFVSEWDTPWPNEFRADSSLLMAAAGSLQGWGGFTIHTYMYATRRDQDVIGKELAARTISNVPYREGIFATWNDPAKFGMFYHAALITRRADVRRAEQSLAVAIDDLTRTPGNTPAFSLVAEQSKIGLVFDGEPHGADKVIDPDTCVVDEKAGEVTSDTGEMWRSWAKRVGKIDSPRTQCIYGFLGKAGELSTQSMTVSASNEYAVVALSSLTDAAIDTSDNLLLTTVGRAENTDMKFNEDRTEVLDTGKAPIQIEVIEADIAIQTDKKNLTVWSIGPEGFYTGRIPSTCVDGVLKFHLGDTCQSMYYLILEE